MFIYIYPKKCTPPLFVCVCVYNKGIKLFTTRQTYQKVSFILDGGARLLESVDLYGNFRISNHP